MEEISWITNNIDKLTLLTWPAVALLLAFIFRDSIKSYINFYINKKQGNGSDLNKRFEALEQKANHEHSEEIRQLQKDFRTLDNKVDDLTGRMIRIETKLNGKWYGYPPQNQMADVDAGCAGGNTDAAVADE